MAKQLEGCSSLFLLIRRPFFIEKYSYAWCVQVIILTAIHRPKKSAKKKQCDQDTTSDKKV
jgi:hypothetical protein